MNQGSVVQEGTAEDLYHRPADEFVATFVGRVNLLPGTLAVLADGVATVAALGASLRARTDRTDLGPGKAVKLVLRPEALELVAAGTTPLNATVVSRTYLGEKIEYAVRCAGIALQAVRYNEGRPQAYAAGSTIGLRIAEDALTVLPERAR
jgi:iron(III) transport system ATP-binding protein